MLVFLFLLLNFFALQGFAQYFHAKHICKNFPFNSQFFVSVIDPSQEGFVSTTIGPFDLSEAVIVVDRDDTLIKVQTLINVGDLQSINRTNMHNFIDQVFINGAPVYILSAASFCHLAHNKLLGLFDNFLNVSENPELIALVGGIGGTILNSIIYTNRYGHEPGIRCPDKEPFLKLISDCYPDKMIYFFDNDFCYCQEVLNQYRERERTYSLAVFWLPLFDEDGIIGWIKDGYTNCPYWSAWQSFKSRIVGMYIDDFMHYIDDSDDESGSDFSEGQDYCGDPHNLLRLDCSD